MCEFRCSKHIDDDGETDDGRPDTQSETRGRTFDGKYSITRLFRRPGRTIVRNVAKRPVNIDFDRNCIQFHIVFVLLFSKKARENQCVLAPGASPLPRYYAVDNFVTLIVQYTRVDDVTLTFQ